MFMLIFSVLVAIGNIVMLCFVSPLPILSWTVGVLSLLVYFAILYRLVRHPKGYLHKHPLIVSDKISAPAIYGMIIVTLISGVLFLILE